MTENQRPKRREAPQCRNNKILYQNTYYAILDVSTEAHLNAVVLIDTEDVQKVVNGPRWRVGSKYVFRTVRKGSVRTTQLLHRFLLGEPNTLIDHISREVFDCRKSNLRLSNANWNAQNRKAQKDSAISYKGVYYTKNKQKYRAGIKFNGTQIHLGVFTTAEEAAAIYDTAALLFFGENAAVNFRESL